MAMLNHGVACRAAVSSVCHIGVAPCLTLSGLKLDVMMKKNEEREDDDYAHRGCCGSCGGVGC